MGMSLPSPLSSQTAAPVLVLGPAHAGKSELAMRLFRPDEPAVVIGTASVRERAFQERLEYLKGLRPAPWESVDAEQDLPGLVDDAAGRAGQVMIDAVSQWLATLVVERDESGESALFDFLKAQVEELGRVMKKHQRCRFVLVSAEVGASPAPARAPERLYRQAVGLANQRLAALSETVLWVTAGLPLKLKG
jgi:adenosylcobinamide kinase/adenosylcobinamide-phosphate guanylyltransferase